MRHGIWPHARNRQGRVWCATVAIALTMLATACGDDDSGSGHTQCAALMQRELEAVAMAQLDTLTECVNRIDGTLPGFSPAACVVGDPLGSLKRAADHAVRTEAERCSGPEIGYTNAVAVVGAGLAVGNTLAHGLFGRDFDTASKRSSMAAFTSLRSR